MKKHQKHKQRKDTSLRTDRFAVDVVIDLSQKINFFKDSAISKVQKELCFSSLTILSSRNSSHKLKN